MADYFCCFFLAASLYFTPILYLHQLFIGIILLFSLSKVRESCRAFFFYPVAQLCACCIVGAVGVLRSIVREITFAAAHCEAVCLLERGKMGFDDVNNVLSFIRNVFQLLFFVNPTVMTTKPSSSRTLDTKRTFKVTVRPML